MSKYKVLEETSIEGTEIKTEKKDENLPKVKNDKKEIKAKKQPVIGVKLSETVSELKKVTWPTFTESLKKTGVVLAFVSISLILLLLIDLLLRYIIELL